MSSAKDRAFRTSLSNITSITAAAYITPDIEMYI